MKPVSKESLFLALLALAAAAVSPNVFPAAQAGIAKMSDLALRALLPSVVLLIGVAVIALWRRHRMLAGRMIAGAAAGAIATLGLEAIRIPSFLLGGMPGDLPRLMGVLLTDRFMLGPSSLSDVIGYAYHLWNGACFGVIFAVIFGRRSLVWTLAYGEAIGIGFLVSPAVRAMGVGFLGLKMPAMTATVLVAHLAFGLVLGLLLRRWVPDGKMLFRELSPTVS